MPSTRLLQQSLIGGEVSPLMLGRPDDARYRGGAAKCLNFIVKPQGSARTRPGTGHIGAAHDSTQRVRLIPFKFSASQELMLAFSNATVDARSIGNVRFYTNRATLLYTQPRLYVVSSTISTTTAGAYTNGVDLAGNKVLMATNHGLTVGDPVAFTFGGAGSLSTSPAGLFASNAVVYAIVIDADELAFATTVANALADVRIDLTATAGGAGDRRVHFAYQPGDLVHSTVAVGGADLNAYCMSRPYLVHADDHPPTNVDFWYRQPGTFLDGVTFDTGTDRVLWTAHGQVAGVPVSFSGTTAPFGITFGTTYYVLNPTANDFQISATPFGPVIDIGVGAVAVSVLAGGIYEVPHGYANADLFDLTYDQSGDVLSIAHPSYFPAELRRLGATTWVTTVVTTGSSLGAPTGLNASPTIGATSKIQAITVATPAVFTTYTDHGLLNGDELYIDGVLGITGVPDGFYVVDTRSTNTFTLKDVPTGHPVGTSGGPYTADSGRLRITSLSSDTVNDYVVTTIAPDGTESVASGPTTTINNLFVSGAKNTLTWNAVAGALRYNVYRKIHGKFAFIGQSVETTFIDDGIDPDEGFSPPVQDTTLTKPAAVGHFEQRRGWALNQTVWLTKSGTESDLGSSLPVLDSDRIRFEFTSRQRASTRHIVPLAQLMLLTDIGEYRVSAINTDALTPGSVMVRPQSYVGANNVQPVIVNGTAVFAAARGGHLRELGFDQERQSYLTGDLSLRATHLFDGLTIVDLAFQKSPHPIVWAVSSDGRLLGITYVPEEQVGAVHQHRTDGFVESVGVVAEGNEDTVYLVVRRTVNGATVRHIEAMGAQGFTTLAAAFQVDDGATYVGVATTTIGGLLHLAGRTVAVLADGLVQSQKVVSATGTVALDVAASTVHVGLPMVTPQIDTLPIAMQIEAMGQSRQKNVNKVSVRCVDSGRFSVAQIGKDAVSSDPRNERAGTVVSRLVEVVASPAWSDDGQVSITVPEPVPVEITAFVLEVPIGG